MISTKLRHEYVKPVTSLPPLSPDYHILNYIRVKQITRWKLTPLLKYNNSLAPFRAM